MLKDLAMTWMNRLSLRDSLDPAKSEIISPRRFRAIIWMGVTHTHTSELYFFLMIVIVTYMVILLRLLKPIFLK